MKLRVKNLSKKKKIFEKQDHMLISLTWRIVNYIRLQLFLRKVL